MTDKIRMEDTTPEQWAQIAAIREDFRARGTSTAPADRKTTERVITKLYAAEKRPKPTFLWTNGPACSAELRARIGTEQDPKKVRKILKEMPATFQPEWKLDVSAFSSSASSVPLYWIARGRAAALLGVQYPADLQEQLQDWEDLCSACGWWIAAGQIVICSERNEKNTFDDEYRLHCADGPAILCRDGFSVYAWHGTRIPRAWIEEKESIDPTLALTHPNMEQRLALTQILGWGKILEKMPAKTIDKDKDPMIGRLFECDLPDAPKSRFIEVLCGTGRSFVLAVPPETKTALEGNAWTYGLEAKEYKLDFRT
jgi:hypothetical protein